MVMGGSLSPLRGQKGLPMYAQGHGMLGAQDHQKRKAAGFLEPRDLVFAKQKNNLIEPAIKLRFSYFACA